MSATMGGAVKAWVESAGLGLAAYRDGAPNDGADPPVITAPLPCVVVQEGIGYAQELHGDTQDPDAHHGTTELVQVDLLEPARVPDPAAGGRTRAGENYPLPDQLTAVFLGPVSALQAHAPWRVYGVSVSRVRLPAAANIIRHSWTLTVRRDTARRA